MELLKVKLNIGVRPIFSMDMIGKERIDFDLSKAINKRELLKADNSFDILLRFLKFINKEEAFYNKISDIYDNMITMDDTTLSVELGEIVDLYTDEDIENFLTKENYISPDILMDVFDNNIIVNKEGSREQTFTKTDYRDLVKLVIKMKSIILLLARYIYIYEINVNTSDNMKVYRVISSIKAISGLPAYKKMLEYVDKNIGGDDSITELDISRVLSKNITRDKFSSFISLSILMYLGITATPDNDTTQHIIVNNMFRLCKNKTAPNRNVMVNDPNISTDEDDSNSSVTDTYMSLSEIPIGYVEELLYAFSNREKIMNQLTITVDLKHLEAIDHLRDTMLDRPLDKAQMALLCWLYFDIIESKYMIYFTKDIIYELRVLAYAILMTHGLVSLANVIMSTMYEDGLYMIKAGQQQASEDLEEKLDELYSITINKKSKNRKYGLSVLDETDALEDSSLKELLYRPVIRRLSTVRWLGYHLPKDSNIFTITNAREEIIKLVSLVCEKKI